MNNKENILAACKQLILQRIVTAEKAMKAAQEGSNSEDKSSAGDKYETARAMGQLDSNMNAKQLAQAQDQLADLLKIDTSTSKTIRRGSLVETQSGLYFVALGLGNITVNECPITVISYQSPLALHLLGRCIGETVFFNQIKIEIKQIL